MAKVRYKKGSPLIPLVDPPKVGALYHVAWAFSRGVQCRVVSVDKDKETAIVKSPSSHKLWANPVKWSDLRHTRKTQSNIELKQKKH